MARRWREFALYLSGANILFPVLEQMPPDRDVSAMGVKRHLGVETVEQAM
jgi:hypothetical protein